MADNPFEPPDEFTYFKNKRADRVYISKSFNSSSLFDPAESRNLRILSKVFDSDEPIEFAQVKNEVVLRVTPVERQEIKVIFYEDTRQIKHLTIQRFASKNGNPHKHGFTFSGIEIETLFNILKLVRYIDLENNEKVRLDDNLINDWLISDDEKKKYFLENLDLVQKISEHHITKSDVVAFAYRKNQLEIFEKLLNDKVFFESQKVEWKARGDEAVWQKFFEQNPWIFGYGLTYIFASQLEGKKLEQVTSGFSFHESGKRSDALMKTSGLISSLCFVEIKTHKTPLLKKDTYRAECWPISDELSGSVAQSQKTVQKAVKSIQTKIQMNSDDGNPTGETVFLYQPKSFIVIGSLDEFLGSNGVNEQKFSSFELFRRNINNPEIITFDELYNRAKFIVKLTEDENYSNTESTNVIISDDDLLF